LNSGKPQRLLVTGGRGRLASLIAGQFRARGDTVSLFSRTTDADHAALDPLLRPGGAEGADALLHLAWSTLPAYAEQDPSAAREKDLPLLEKLLAALAATPANRRPLFVFFSSGGAVYGNAPGRPNREDDACAPVGEYGKAKFAAEQIIASRAQRDGLDVLILRISNPYGYPVPMERQQGLIPHAIRCAVNGQPLALWGDGSARKDFIHCSDFLDGLGGALTRRLTGLYNLCAGESHSVREVLTIVERTVGRKIPLATTPPQAWDVHDSRLDNSRFKAATGWKPRTSLEEGIRRAFAQPAN
jgi:UDP-glucose 4-epimerase